MDPSSSPSVSPKSRVLIQSSFMTPGLKVSLLLLLFLVPNYFKGPSLSNLHDLNRSYQQLMLIYNNTTKLGKHADDRIMDLGGIHGKFFKSPTEGSPQGANKTNNNNRCWDNFDLQDCSYDGPRYKPKSGSNRTVSICAMAKNEEAYLDEWWSYYKALGVSALYLYENADSPSLHQWASIQNNKSASAVHYKHFPTGNMKMPQESAYLDCMNRSLSDGHTWSANLDIDEFLMMYKHKHIVDLLEEYAVNGSLALHWHVFGTNDWEVYSPQPLTKRFRMRGNFAKRVKTVALLADIDMKRRPTCHFVHPKKGKRTFDTTGNDVTERMNVPNKPTDVALLYHYRTKSFKEYVAKRERGRASMAGAVHENWLMDAKKKRIDFKANVYDDRMWTKMKEYVPKYALYDILYQE